jgi:hypothetical protein
MRDILEDWVLRNNILAKIQQGKTREDTALELNTTLKVVDAMLDEYIQMRKRFPDEVEYNLWKGGIDCLWLLRYGHTLTPGGNMRRKSKLYNWYIAYLTRKG